MNKIAKPGYRHYVHFTLKWLLIHLGAMLFRNIFFASLFAQAVEDEKLYIAKRAAFFLSMIATLLFCLYEALRLGGNAQLRRDFRHQETNPSLSELIRGIWKKHWIHTAIFAVLQIPYLIFYSFFGVVYVNSMAIEDFFCIESGFYEIVGNGILGFLLSSLLFFALQMLLELLILRSWKRDEL